ncbi:MAG: methionine adenosyltransferase [Clostridia bacterium]|nr:methionine adenosyltransferase [Clostridia bacterium]
MSGITKKEDLQVKKFFTSESVTEGHPDKVCDNISDGILDAILSVDPNARAAIECAAAFDTLLIMGEVTTTANVNYEQKAREIIKEIGYDFGSFAYDKCKIITAIHSQSPDIAMGVDASLENKTSSEKDEAAQLGAGDQGMMFGYACRETKELMPLTLSLSHRLAKRLTDVRKSGLLPYLRPDGKTQVTVEYENGEAKRVDTVVVSTQHDKEVSQERIREDMKTYVIDEIIPTSFMDEKTKFYINPTGRFEIGGPEGDSGLTGRKIIVDTYGGRCAHVGGAFSGKDPTKVDRSAAYFCRYIAKNLVAAGLADEVEIQVAYAIGVANPVSVFVDSHGTGKLSDERLAKIVKTEFDLRPYAIIKTLDLRKPVFKKTAAYGHFGYKGFSWEQTDRVEDLKKYL